MSEAKLFALVAVFFFTSVLSVVTGSTTLITVPVMIGLGIEAHVAIATNMLALTLMSVGGSLPFMGRGVLSRRHLPPSIILTLIGSGFGALTRTACEHHHENENEQTVISQTLLVHFWLLPFPRFIFRMKRSGTQSANWAIDGRF